MAVLGVRPGDACESNILQSASAAHDPHALILYESVLHIYRKRRSGSFGGSFCSVVPSWINKFIYIVHSSLSPRIII